MPVKKLILYFSVSLFFFTIAGNSYALKFPGDAWMAQYIENGNPTDEYFLIINETDIQKVQLKGFKFKKSPVERDFSQLTNQEGNEGVTYYQVNTKKSKKFRSLKKKARKKSNKLIEKGLLAKEGRRDWIDEWVTEKLEDRLFKLVFNNDGKKYKGRIGFAAFENLLEEDIYYNWDYTDDDFLEGGDPEVGADRTPAPVPEPGTMILLSTGLLGIIGVRGRFKK